MFRIAAGLLSWIAFVALVPGPMAQELAESSVEDLVQREEIRSAVETAIENYLGATGGKRIDAAIEGIRSLSEYGDKAVPYLANELEQENLGSYDFVAYALGVLESPAAEIALREAIERAEATPGAASMARKAWVCWALSLHGEIDALKLVNEGTHRSAKFPMHRQMTVLEVIAVQTAPESVPILLQQLETWSEIEDQRGDQRFVLRALRRLGHSASEPALIKIIEQNKDQPALRAQTADALRSVETPDSVAALTLALQDPEPGVRRAAAFALMWMDRPGDVAKLLEILASEEDLRVREALYKIVAAHAQPAQVPQFLAQWNRPDPEDRRHFISVLPSLKSDKATSILLQAIEDPSEAVAMTAVIPLAETEDPAALSRLREVLASTPRWGIVREIAKVATANDIEKLAPPLVQRFVEASKLDAESQRGLMSATDRMAEALIALRYTSALSKIRRAREAATDSEMIEVLDGTIDAMELLRKNGKDVAKWIPLLRDADPMRSRLARHRLAELGGEASTNALLEAYDGLDTLAKLDTLLLLERMDSPAVRALLRRLLLEPEYYEGEHEGERKTTAGIVRSFGDQEMLDLLIEAVRLRDGRDVENLIYVAAIAQKEALPLLDEYRLSRFQYLSLTRGYEQEVLDWIARRLESGLPIERYDQPANRMVIR